VLDDPTMTTTLQTLVSSIAALVWALWLARSNGVSFGNGIAAPNGVS
jgi:hypothetical protein